VNPPRPVNPAGPRRRQWPESAARGHSLSISKLRGPGAVNRERPESGVFDAGSGYDTITPKRLVFSARPQWTCGSVYNEVMGKNVIHISEAEAASDFATLMARVSAGTEIVIEKDKRAIAVLHPAEPVRRTISECIALLPEDSTATIDADFPKDVEAAVASLREPLSPPAWD